jgi:thymidine kinase
MHRAVLEVICGPMFAGKTTELMRRIAAARDAGQRVLVVKPAHDTRYAQAAIVTHTGERVPAKAQSSPRSSADGAANTATDAEADARTHEAANTAPEGAPALGVPKA